MIRRALERVFPRLWMKIAVAITTVLLLAGITFVYFAQKTGYLILEQESQAKAHGIAELVRGILSHVDVDSSGAYVREVLKLVASAPEVEDAFILSTDGTVVWRTRSSPEKQHFSIEQFHGDGTTNDERFLSVKEDNKHYEYILTPLVQKSGTTTDTHGYFGMKISMDDIRAIALGHRTMNIIMTSLTLVGLGIIIFLALTLLVIQPIRSLHMHIRHIQGGVKQLENGEEMEFPLLPEPRQRGEISDLCRTFNALIERLNSANAIVHELHQRQLEQADRLATVGEIAASMAHEIKNPVAGVLGALQVFSDDVAESDPRKEILDEMKIQLERVNHAVNDLLAYARPNPPLFEDCSVNELIEKTLKLLGQQAKGKQIIIDYHLDPTLQPIIADKKQLQQVFWNVMLNGLQAINGSGGTLTVTSCREDHDVVISVQDTGVGMSAEHQRQVFQPFFTTKHKGTGLGMTVSKRIMEQQHGFIHVSSTQGEGTIVRLVLPQKIGERA